MALASVKPQLPPSEENRNNNDTHNDEDEPKASVALQTPPRLPSRTARRQLQQHHPNNYSNINRADSGDIDDNDNYNASALSSKHYTHRYNSSPSLLFRPSPFSNTANHFLPTKCGNAQNDADGDDDDDDERWIKSSWRRRTFGKDHAYSQHKNTINKNDNNCGGGDKSSITSNNYDCHSKRNLKIMRRKSMDGIRSFLKSNGESKANKQLLLTDRNTIVTLDHPKFDDRDDVDHHSRIRAWKQRLLSYRTTATHASSNSVSSSSSLSLSSSSSSSSSTKNNNPTTKRPNGNEKENRNLSSFTEDQRVEKKDINLAIRIVTSKTDGTENIDHVHDCDNNTTFLSFMDRKEDDGKTGTGKTTHTINVTSEQEKEEDEDGEYKDGIKIAQDLSAMEEAWYRRCIQDGILIRRNHNPTTSFDAATDPPLDDFQYRRKLPRPCYKSSSSAAASTTFRQDSEGEDGYNVLTFRAMLRRLQDEDKMRQQQQNTVQTKALSRFQQEQPEGSSESSTVVSSGLWLSETNPISIPSNHRSSSKPKTNLSQQTKPKQISRIMDHPNGTAVPPPPPPPPPQRSRGTPKNVRRPKSSKQQLPIPPKSQKRREFPNMHNHGILILSALQPPPPPPVPPPSAPKTKTALQTSKSTAFRPNPKAASSCTGMDIVPSALLKAKTVSPKPKVVSTQLVSDGITISGGGDESTSVEMSLLSWSTTTATITTNDDDDLDLVRHTNTGAECGSQRPTSTTTNDSTKGSHLSLCTKRTVLTKNRNLMACHANANATNLSSPPKRSCPPHQYFVPIIQPERDLEPKPSPIIGSSETPVKDDDEPTTATAVEQPTKQKTFPCDNPHKNESSGDLVDHCGTQPDNKDWLEILSFSSSSFNTSSSSPFEYLPNNYSQSSSPSSSSAAPSSPPPSYQERRRFRTVVPVRVFLSSSSWDSCNQPEQHDSFGSVHDPAQEKLYANLYQHATLR